MLDRIPTLIARYKQRLLAQAFERVGLNGHVTHLGDIAAFVTSGSRGWAQYSESGDLFIRVGNVRRTAIELDLSNVQRVTPPEGAEGLRTRLEENDLLVTITADLGRIGVFTSNEPAYVNQHVALVRLWEPAQANYIAWYLASEPGQVQLHRNTRGATKAGLGLDDIREVEIPLPALEEQTEIVRRIESAFGWLDRMAADHAAAARLLPKLDAAILAKAFRGELVPQDPNDEPASVLLERIRAEREAAPEKTRGRQPKVTNISGEASIKFTASGTLTDAPKKSGAKPMTKSRQDDDVMGKPYLAGKLKALRSGSVQVLFMAADLPVADFYKQLAWEISAKHIIDDPEELKAA